LTPSDRLIPFNAACYTHFMAKKNDQILTIEILKEELLNLEGRVDKNARKYRDEVLNRMDVVIGIILQLRVLLGYLVFVRL